RSLTWGGIPIALPAFGVFAFLLFRGVELLLRPRIGRRETQFLIAATLLPVLTSVIYFWISKVELGTVCTVCAGIYGASFGVLVSAIGAHWGASRATERFDWSQWLLYFMEGCALVLVPVLLYLAQKPVYPDVLSGKNELRHAEDRYGVMLASKGSGRVPAIEVLDPLCPACKAFSQRLAATDLGRDLALQTVLFPLDKDCNWMVNESLHPGSCAVSEAVMCAGEKSSVVLAWAFAHQAELLAAGARGQAEVYGRLKQEFPALSPCLGQPLVRTRLNRSLRWVVSNSLPVLTPQLFVRNQKVPDEDTDLGLDFVLARVMESSAPARPEGRR
ncbi:MAG TPA: vitamin K epoxide reductase family protein, partial [Polyangia bacterium]